MSMIDLVVRLYDLVRGRTPNSDVREQPSKLQAEEDMATQRREIAF